MTECCYLHTRRRENLRSHILHSCHFPSINSTPKNSDNVKYVRYNLKFSQNVYNYCHVVLNTFQTEFVLMFMTSIKAIYRRTRNNRYHNNKNMKRNCWKEHIGVENTSGNRNTKLVNKCELKFWRCHGHPKKYCNKFAGSLSRWNFNTLKNSMHYTWLQFTTLLQF
jgi:hypothetical protein